MEIEPKKRKEKGIFGVERSRTLFSFAGELWSDEDSKDDLEYRLPNSTSIAENAVHEPNMEEQTVTASTSINNSCEEPANGEPLKERITLTFTKKRKRGRRSKNDSSSDYFISKNGENNVSTKMKAKVKKKEPYEDLDTKILKQEAVMNAHYGEINWKLNLQPFLNSSDSEVNYLLPTNILTKIFHNIVNQEPHKAIHNLLSLSQASETFRKLIISTASLWKCVDFTDFKYNTAERDIMALCEAGILSRVEKLNVSGWITGNSLCKLIECCAPSLNEIVLRECHAIGAECLQLLAERCVSLENIDLSRTSYSNFNPRPRGKETKRTVMEKNNLVQASSLKPFLSTCGFRLKQLNLAENKLLSFTSITSAIMTHCPNLRLLDLSNIETSSSSVIDIPKLQQSCPLLKVLRLANITLKASSHSPYSFTQLEELSIPVKSATCGHSDTVIYALTRTAEHLSLLDIRGSSEVSVSCLVKIPAWNLQHLSISNCQRLCTPDLELLFSKWKNSLVEVDMSWNNNDTSVNASLEALCGDDMSVLKSINLRGSSVSLPTLKNLFKCCKKLELIDLQSCRGLPRGIKRVFADFELLKLKKDVVDGMYD